MATALALIVSKPACTLAIGRDAADCPVYDDILAVLNLQPDFLYFPPYSLGPMKVTANDIYLSHELFPATLPRLLFRSPPRLFVLLLIEAIFAKW